MILPPPALDCPAWVGDGRPAARSSTAIPLESIQPTKASRNSLRPDRKQKIPCSCSFKSPPAGPRCSQQGRMWSFIGPPTQGLRSRYVSTMAIPWRFPAPPRGAMDSSQFSPRTPPNPPTTLTGQGWAGSGFCAISHGLLFFWGDCQIDHPLWISQAETTAIILLEIYCRLFMCYTTPRNPA